MDIGTTSSQSRRDRTAIQPELLCFHLLFDDNMTMGLVSSLSLLLGIDIANFPIGLCSLIMMFVGKFKLNY